MFKFIEAKKPSDILDPSTTLGIEITVPEVATRCGLGNLDGQHGTGSVPYDEGAINALLGRNDWGGAAIAIALAVYPPVDGTIFATSRPDLDSIGAMAVLVLRSLGLAEHIDRELVKAIAAADSFRSGAWTPCSLPTEESPWPRGASTIDSTPQTAHLGLVCSPRKGDFTESLSLAERVATIAIVLTRDFAEYHATMMRVFDACGVERGAFPGLDALIDRARREVRGSRLALVQAALDPAALTDHGSFVEVRVAHAGALSLGYCMRPVVVAFDQQVARKVTICGYTDGHLDAVGLTAELNRLELAARGFRAIHLDRVYADGRRERAAHAVFSATLAVKAQAAMATTGAVASPPFTVEFVTEYAGDVFRDGLPPSWGGPRNMCNSPQHGGTTLADDAIVSAVKRFVISA
jgi:hypothetical protein